MKKFREFVDQKVGNVADPSTHVLEIEELLQRILRQHGSRFRSLLKNVIRNGDIDDDPELLEDLKELAKSLSQKATGDQYPIRGKQRNDREPDIVSRPHADGGSGPGDGKEGGGE